MKARLHGLAPRAVLRRRPRSARLRLTLLYGGLFLLLGTGLIALVYALTAHTSAIHVHAVAVRRVGHRRVVIRVNVAGGGPTPGVAPPPGLAGQVRAGAVAQRSAVLSQLLEVSWVVLALTTLGALILGWFAAGRVLAPLRSITATARTISAGNLHQRLALTGPDDEFKQLGDTLDELLGRLEASFDAQRRFVANASHELRTPMTLERTLLQVALADPDADAERLRETCRELLTSQAEHERLLDGLLTLASSERGLDRHAALDLAKLAGTVVAAAGERPEPGVPHLTAVLDPAPCHGDQALLVRLIANLIDNATEHNVPDGSVTIHTGMQDGAATIAVQNTGPVIRPEQVEPLFEPFRRLGPERTGTGGHYGLGLSIVRAITVAHGATVTAVAQATGGLVVRVRFPPTP